MKKEQKRKKKEKAVTFPLTKKTLFPTVGEITLAVFKYSGLWELLPKKKKSMERKLERFATEEKILSKFEMNEIFKDYFNEITDNNQLSWILADLVVGLLYGYPLLLRNNASFLNRKETIRWIMKVSLPAPLVIALQTSKAFAKHPSVELSNMFNDIDFQRFLPSFNGKETIMPFSKILKYLLNDILQKSPEKIVKEGDSPNPRTVRNWIEGRQLPNTSYLIDFVKIIDFSEKEKESFLLMILIARFFDFLFQDLIKNYGVEEVKKIVDDFSTLYTAFKNTLIEPVFKSMPFSHSVKWESWKHIVFSRFDEDLSNRLDQELNRAIEEGISDEPSFFDLATKMYLTNLDAFVPAENQAEYIKRSYELLNQSLNTNSENVVEYEESILELEHKKPRDGSLAFFHPLLQARCAIFNKNIEGALKYLIEAFNEGRYASGSLVESILIDLMGVSAYQFSKSDDKKGARGDYWKILKYMRTWAHHHGLCEQYLSDDKREFIELNRRNFSERYRSHLPERERIPIRFGEWDTVSLSSEFDNWIPDFRYPSRIVKFSHRDISQLMVAIVLRQKDNALKLIELGADLDFRNTTNDNAFTYAMDGHFYDVALKLLENGISQKTLTLPTKRWKNNAMKLVISSRQPQLLKKLLERGIDPNTPIIEPPNTPMTPLYRAIHAYGKPVWKEGDVRMSGRKREIVKMLAEQEKQYAGTDEDAFKIIKILLDVDTQIDAPNILAHTALTFACELNLDDVVSLLLEKGANSNHRIAGGATALYFAVENANIKIVRLLLSYGADSTKKRYDGRNVLDFCKTDSIKEIILNTLTVRPANS